MAGVPFHESGQQSVYGVTDECLYNDHPMCRSPRCGCSCHIPPNVSDKPQMADVPAQGYRRVDGLDKYCPKCKLKAASEQNFCKVDGSRLSSLRCPECQTPGDQEDNYCGYCGASMKVEDKQLEDAATGNRVTDGSADISEWDIPPGATITGATGPTLEAAEAAMKAAMASRDKKRVPAPVAPKISIGMFK